MYVQKDFYHKLAKKEGYASRAAYKLKQINGQCHIIKRADTVLDLGAAPGGWSQVALKLAKKVIGVDLIPVNLRNENYQFILGDITSDRVLKQIGTVDVIISDIAPRTTGLKRLDQGRSADLTQFVADIAPKLLKKGGNLLIKTFEGPETKKILEQLKQNFEEAKMIKPKASRQASKEVYIVAKVQKS